MEVPIKEKDNHSSPLILNSKSIKSCSSEDLFNFLFWDYLIVDIRPEANYEVNHIERSQNFPENTNKELSNKSLLWIPDNREKIIIYDKSKISDSSLPFIENTLLPFFVFLFGKNYFELTVDIYFLEGGIESFEQSYPFLCTRHPNYQENLVYPSQITPYLFLSSQLCASTEQVLENLKISSIINVTKSNPNVFENRKENLKISYLRCPIDDSSNCDILQFFSTTSEWIDKCEKQGSKILVHCDRGVSRSCTIVTAYLMWKFHKNVKDALNYVKERRSIVQPNEGFINQLLTFEKLLNK